MQIKNWIVRSLVLGVAALTVDAAFPQIVEARTMGSSIGLTVPAQTNCLEMYHGIWHNTCSTTVSLDIPLTNDTDAIGKRIHVPVYANGPTGSPPGTIGCRAESVSRTLAVTYAPSGGAYIYPTFFPQYQIDLPDLAMFAGGAMVVNCQMGADAWVEVVRWENRNGTDWP